MGPLNQTIKGFLGLFGLKSLGNNLQSVSEQLQVVYNYTPHLLLDSQLQQTTVSIPSASPGTYAVVGGNMVVPEGTCRIVTGLTAWYLMPAGDFIDASVGITLLQGAGTGIPFMLGTRVRNTTIPGGMFVSSIMPQQAPILLYPGCFPTLIVHENLFAAPRSIAVGMWFKDVQL